MPKGCMEGSARTSRRQQHAADWQEREVLRNPVARKGTDVNDGPSPLG